MRSVKSNPPVCKSTELPQAMRSARRVLPVQLLQPKRLYMKTKMEPTGGTPVGRIVLWTLVGACGDLAYYKIKEN